MVDSLDQRGEPLASAFRNILRLSAGDAVAKTLNFLAFVYLARILGVERFGMLEFAGGLLVYFLLLADGGLEMWATRESSRTSDLKALAGHILPLRMLLALVATALLFGIRPFLPAYPQLSLVMGLYSLSLFAQAASLKWAFLGREEMSRVAWGLVLSQVAFAALVLLFVHGPENVAVVPLLRFGSDAVLAGYFAAVFGRAHGWGIPVTLRGASVVLRPALTIGTSQAMGLLNYNFDSVLLGFLTTARTVGLYNAAYKPVTIALALPLTYFVGLFPALSRTHAESREEFRGLVERSLRLAGLMAAPLAAGGTLLAAPVIALLFGASYAESASVLPILIWSAVFVILRGSYRHALTAAGHQALDLRCAMVSTGLNVGLNLLLIPRYGMMGAASATVIGDLAWFVLAYAFFQVRVMPLPALPCLWRPLVAGAAMAGFLWFTQATSMPWVLRGAASVAIYAGCLLIIGEPETRAWMRRLGKRES